MDFSLTQKQMQYRKKIHDLVDEKIFPYADEYDSNEATPKECLEFMGENGILGAIIPKEYGGQDLDPICFGILCEEIGRGSCSLLSLLTVHSMVSLAITKWGTKKQREFWLPQLATGKKISAFGLTEPNVGSHAVSIETKAEENGETFILNGTKKWISYAQVADLFLIIGQCNKGITAFLVENDRPGISVQPINGVVGFRAAMLGEVRLEDCQISAENLVGRIGFGFSHVANSALNLGRYCVAWGCLGLCQACLDASLDYSSTRKQGQNKLRKYQLIQEMIAEMIANVKAVRMLCYHAAWLRATGDPESIMETSIAKYFASHAVNKCASDTLQIHGANGCSKEYPVQRYWRDARIMEIIEGSTQIQQLLISKYGFQSYIKADFAREKGAKDD